MIQDVKTKASLRWKGRIPVLKGAVFALPEIENDRGKGAVHVVTLWPPCLFFLEGVTV